jgi:AmpD protein
VPASSPRLYVDRGGSIRAARQILSPNCDARPRDAAITLLVVHNISLPPGRFGGNAIVELFTNRLDPAAHPYYATIAKLRVSAHFLIRRDGALIQFVPCALRAWHAGPSRWRGRAACNDFSIGVELEGTDELAYESAQYATLARLTRALRRRYPIAEMVGHRDIAPGRKTDPGPAFDWVRYRRSIAGRGGSAASWRRSNSKVK